MTRCRDLGRSDLVPALCEENLTHDVFAREFHLRVEDLLKEQVKPLDRGSSFDAPDAESSRPQVRCRCRVDVPSA